jgi:uncharacterized protein (DUF2147 family)
MVIAVGTATTPNRAGAIDDITGVWLTDRNEAAIEIHPCGQQRCGRIVWMRDPIGNNGQPLTDSHNPNLSLRSRPLCGLTIISGLTPRADGSWGQGKVYNPDNGNTYDMEMQRAAPEILRVTGYLGFTFLGQTTDWRRAPKDLGTCSAARPRSPRR